jgi:RimJ/RimL family protein N-acetyltransferase
MDAPIRTARLVLSPVEAEDADELAAVFADDRLYAFTGGGPGTVEELRGTLGRLARERAGDPCAQRNWVVRRLADRQAVGMLQAAFGGGGRSAEIAWLVGVPWQGQGLASEAAAAVVGWLEARGVAQVTAWIRPDHHASEAVATRAGLMVTSETRTTDKHEHLERLWRRDLGPGGRLGPARHRHGLR